MLAQGVGEELEVLGVDGLEAPGDGGEAHRPGRLIARAQQPARDRVALDLDGARRDLEVAGQPEELLLGRPEPQAGAAVDLDRAVGDPEEALVVDHLDQAHQARRVGVQRHAVGAAGELVELDLDCSDAARAA